MKSSWLVAFVFFAALLAVFGCAWIIGASFVKPGNATATPKPAALIAEVSPNPKPTATSTVTPWPTADLRYLEAAKAEAEIAEKNANAAQSQANAQSTIVANAGIIATITKAYEYDVATQEAGTATAAPSVTAQAYQIIQRVNDETLRTQQESEKSRNESIKELIVWSVGGALVLMVGVVIAYAIQIGLHNMAQKIYDQRDQELPQPTQTTTLIPKGTDAWERTSFTRVPDPPGDPVKIILWAETVLAGGSVAVDVWEQAGPFTGNREYRHGIYAWLVRNNLIVLKNKMVLNDLGIQIVTKYVDNHSPTQEIRPETAPLSSVSGENDTDNASGGGDAREWTPFDSIK